MGKEQWEHIRYTHETIKLIKELQKTSMLWCPVCGKAPLNMIHCAACCPQPWTSPLMCSFFSCSLDSHFILLSSLQGRTLNFGAFHVAVTAWTTSLVSFMYLSRIPTGQDMGNPFLNMRIKGLGGIRYLTEPLGATSSQLLVELDVKAGAQSISANNPPENL